MPIPENSVKGFQYFYHTNDLYTGYYASSRVDGTETKDIVACVGYNSIAIHNSIRSNVYSNYWDWRRWGNGLIGNLCTINHYFKIGSEYQFGLRCTYDIDDTWYNYLKNNRY